MTIDLYSSLTKRIDDAYIQFKNENKFYTSIFDGSIKKETVTSFLLNTSSLTVQTPKHLKLAFNESRKMGLTSLSAFYRLKFSEEVGHEKWGEDDVKSITGQQINILSNLNINPELQTIIDANSAMIKKHPYSYFIYILFAEYYTVIAGPECMNAIQIANGVSRDQMSIIGKHAELDQHHVQNWAIESKMLGSFGFDGQWHFEVLDQILARYNAFTESLATHQSALNKSA